MEVKHTPTPWMRESDINQHGSDYFLVTEDYRTIADLRLDDSDGSNVSIDEQEANADYIVRACNAHAGLVAALEDLMSLYFATKGHDPNFIDKARAALALAKGDAA